MAQAAAAPASAQPPTAMLTNPRHLDSLSSTKFLRFAELSAWSAAGHFAVDTDKIAQFRVIQRELSPAVQAPRESRKIVAAQRFSLIRSPDALSSVRNAG